MAKFFLCAGRRLRPQINEPFQRSTGAETTSLSFSTSYTLFRHAFEWISQCLISSMLRIYMGASLLCCWFYSTPFISSPLPGICACYLTRLGPHSIRTGLFDSLLLSFISPLPISLVGCYVFHQLQWPLVFVWTDSLCANWHFRWTLGRLIHQS